MSDKPMVVLAFSGGLDTSFCVPYLIDKGYAVHTVFVDTGGTDEAGRAAVRERAESLGAAGHTTIDAGPVLWETFVVPFVRAGAKYMDRYPLLCSDRYVIAAAAVDLAHRLGASAIAHGCTAMGNDQFRFDQSIRCLSGLPILAPIREIQALTDSPRRYEMDDLMSRGFTVPEEAKAYTINENVLGVTVSGSEIDELREPGEGTRKLTRPRAAWPVEPLRVEVGFERGVPRMINGRPMEGVEILSLLNERFGAYGVGRGIYTGDTIVGLKGRIVYECPGLEALLTAHRALEELTLTKLQNRFKAQAAAEWARLVFGGLFYEPLRADIEAFITSTQANVTGTVVLKSEGGLCLPVAVETDNALTDDEAVYAQRAGWSAADAEGFIRIAGNASALGAAAAARRGGADPLGVLTEFKQHTGVSA